MTPIEQLLRSDPYAWSEADRQLFLEALHDEYRFHFSGCNAYRRYCERRGLSADSRFEHLGEFPYLPVQAFKDHAGILTSVAESEIHTRLHSSATSGVASTVHIDKVTAKRQIRALTSVLGEILGQRRRPFLVLDVDARKWGTASLGARGAAVRGFLNLSRETQYFMSPGPDGRLELQEKELVEALAKAAERDEPVVIFGFTYVLFAHVIMPLRERGVVCTLPPGSFVAHIGGWKKLESQKIDKTAFNSLVAETFGIAPTSVVDFYGFTEQMGVTYPDDAEGAKRVPVFADVVVRDPVTYRPVSDGEVGLLEFVTPIPHSYPGIAILTDDIGVVVQRDARHGGVTHFKVLGRAKKAEARGCGDIMGEKVARPAATAGTTSQALRVHLLADAVACHVPKDLNETIDTSHTPEVSDLAVLTRQLREQRHRLDAYSVDDLAALIGAAATRWMSPESTVAPFRHQGLFFLANWCRPDSLRQMADRSLYGHRGHLDHFRPVANNNKRLLRAQPRGLVAHWLSGNVPVLGMLVLVQSILARNANLLKVASTFSSVMPLLLEAFRGLEVKTHAGKTLRGDDILASIAVVYFSRDHGSAAETFSTEADVRVAWGGREAIESILNLPKRFGTEDIIFGPKLSYMAIGREFLRDEYTLKRIARRAAVDASVFDQYACASPHTIFVEKGGTLTPRDFAAALAHEMSRAAIRIPKVAPDAGTAGEIARKRMAYELNGELWASSGTEWTVLYDDRAAGLAEPCYSRVITVRAIDDIMEAAELAHPGIQTVGLALEGSRKLEFADRVTRRGAERCPDVGRMTFFDAPWDGLFPLDRLVRWVSVGGPLT